MKTLAEINAYWKQQHNRALARPKPGFEAALVNLIIGVQGYAEVCRMQERPIGEDGVLGPEWQSICLSIIALLNGEIGRLDAGTVDGFIRGLLKQEGMTDDAAKIYLAEREDT